MKAITDLDFLSNYWKELQKIKRKLNDLSCGVANYKPLNKGSKIILIPFKDLNSWSVQDILYNGTGKSETVMALVDKISYMIDKGRANDVKPMLEKICSGRIKSLSHIRKNSVTSEQLDKNREVYSSRYLGKGHFRWNYQAYTLNPLELQKVKEYFKL